MAWSAETDNSSFHDNVSMYSPVVDKEIENKRKVEGTCHPSSRLDLAPGIY